MTPSKGYWIAHVTVTNPERYPEYAAASTAAIEKGGGKFIVRGGRFEAVEGDARERHVVVEFENYQSAVECYRSTEYQTAAKLRQAFGDSNILIVEGAAVS
jgi:uncharacterized protein (DUF1330 family)